jgi:hypothetical protein
MVSSEEVLKKYSRLIESKMGSERVNYSQDYTEFKEEMIPKMTRYERWAKSIGGLVKIKLGQKDQKTIQRQLDIAHLDVTASQAVMLSLLSAFFIFFAILLISVSMYLINKSMQTSLIFLGLIASGFIFYYAYSMPKRLANAWRLKASSQMVPAILYTVVYMKHTSNLERAIRFASEHLEGNLALDFKKIFYDVEIGRFTTIKQALDNYFEGWRDYAPEFIESFHLIESSLFEPSEARRIQILEKSLQVILDGVYEKMLKYSREIRSPLTNLYMLGIILPTLALALLPLASTLLGDSIKWPQLMIIFNFIIPFFVFYMTSEILLKRPGGYGETSVLELNPDYSKYTSKKPWIVSSLIALPFLILGFLPFILQNNFISSLFNLQRTNGVVDFGFEQLGINMLQGVKAFDFQILNGNVIGPFGILAVILSLFIPFALMLFFSIAYKLKTKSLIKAREDTKVLEEEFTNSLFILGNRIGEGIPAEIALSKVVETTRGQITQNFFAVANQNIQQLGMSLEKAIFDKRRGAIVFYPSALIATSMKILVESVKKGLQVAAASLMSISDYVKNIQKINQRLKDLLAEIVSDMKSNMTFLAPLLAGIVMGLATMITIILNKLKILQNLTGDGAGMTGFDLKSILGMFDVTKMIPPFFVQIVIGIYIVEIIFILTSALVTVDSGRDPLKEKYELSLNIIRGVGLYIVTALVSILALSLLANIAIGGLTG